MINTISKDIERKGVQPQEFIEKARANSKDSTLSPASFKKAIESAVSQDVKAKLSDSILRNLIHYLVREEPARVSFNKLYQALALPVGESPLK